MSPPVANDDAPPPPARKRWLIALGLSVMLAGLGAVPWVMVPQEQVVDLLLRQLGPDMQLKLTRSGAATWRLRGGPMLEVHGLSVAQAGTEIPWLHAERVLLAVPWRTVYSLGKTLDMTRIEVDAPQLDLPALRRWLDSRIPGEEAVSWPTLSSGFEIDDGQLHGNGWNIEAITLQLPDFSSGAPVRATLSGDYAAADTQARFDLRLAMTRSVLPAGAEIVGSVDIQRETTSIPARFTLSGPLQIENGQWRIPALRLALEGELSRPDSPSLPFALTLGGALDIGGTLTLLPLTLDFTGNGPLPSLNAIGEAVLAGEHLRLHLSGEMPQWPRAWPALPTPLNQRGPLGFILDYTGMVDFSSPTRLQLQRGQTRLEAIVLPVQLADWLARPSSSLLPPLRGRLTTPVLELPGVTLHGIEIESEP